MSVFFFCISAQARNVSSIPHHTYERDGKHVANTNNKVGAKINRAKIAEEIKKEFVFSWNAYKKYAWGYDELEPVKKSGKNWYSVSFYMTLVDALDTMILMGFKTEADSVREFLDTHLDFNQNVFVSNFEFTIRFLGGLLSSYQLTHDKQFFTACLFTVTTLAQSPITIRVLPLSM